MDTEFYSLMMTRDELVETHRALLARFITENILREEQGLEPIDDPAALIKIEKMLGLTPEQSHQLFHQVEDELWAHAWLAYTDEWAWYRAKQEAQKAAGGPAGLSHEALDRKIEELYEKNFDRYAAEIDMQTERDGKKIQK